MKGRVPHDEARRVNVCNSSNLGVLGWPEETESHCQSKSFRSLRMQRLEWMTMMVERRHYHHLHCS